MAMPAISAQELYRAIDQNGVVTYTDNPKKIQGSTQAQSIKIDITPASRSTSQNPNHFFTPFTLESGHIFIEVELTNGAKTRKTKLVYDTGAPMLVIHRRIAADLGLKPWQVVPNQLSDGINQKIVRIALTPVNLKFGLATFARFPAAWHMDQDYLGPPWDWDGMLGMSVIQRFETRIDYEKKQIEWIKLKKAQ